MVSSSPRVGSAGSHSRRLWNGREGGKTVPISSANGIDNGAYRVHSNGARVTSVQEWLYRVLGIRPFVPRCVNSGGALQRRLGIQAAQEHFQRQGGAIERLAGAPKARSFLGGPRDRRLDPCPAFR